MIKKLINNLLKKSGYALYKKTEINYYSVDQLKQLYDINGIDVRYIKSQFQGGLRDKLLKENKTKWIDIGADHTLDNFNCVALWPEPRACAKERYFQLDMVTATDEQIEKLGKYDLVRMQHFFEHLEPEDGLQVLIKCAKLLNKDGYILISTPDLKKYVHLYASDKINQQNWDWPLKRIEKDAPKSFYFSIFSHSMPGEAHKWDYDAEGLMYQLERSGKFKNIMEIPLDDDLANSPFTHNRAWEDVCVMAQLK